MKTIKLLLSIMIITLIIPINIIAEEYDLSNYTDEEAILIKEMIDTNPEFNLEDGEVVAISKKRIYIDENKPETRGIIGDAYMDLVVYSQRISGSSGYDTFKFQATAEWKKTPAYQFEDALAIAWGDEFSQYNSSCSTYYKGKGLMSGMASKTNETPDSGLAYSFPTRYGPLHPLEKVIVTVYVKKANSSGETTVVTEYAHATISLTAGIGVSISGTNISFSAAGLLDTMASSVYFEY